MSHLTASIPYPHLDPVLFRIGPVAARWYGLAYLAAFLLGYVGLKRMIQSGKLRLSAGQLSDLISWLVPGVLLGGRIGWWLFYHRNEGATEPWYEPLAIWHGGMSFHGGVAGVALALLVWAWRNRATLLNVADCVALVAPLGLFFGRIANFINAELVGRPTALAWGVVFPGESFARHPSQLYEALLEGALLLIALWAIARRSRSREGVVAAMFLVLYGVLRFAVEFTRQPDERLGFIAFGWLTMGQLLSLALSLVGVLLWFGISVRRAGHVDYLSAVRHTAAFDTPY
jgi:phosphatidylglycerol---prolipoprotein diacylglyceryl transferase